MRSQPTATKPIPELLPSDVLLYGSRCLADFIIYIKTYSDVGHVEIYEGDSMSSAARAQGVNLYPLRLDGLRYVYRPVSKPDNEAAQAWFKSHAQGDRYYWLGLLGFDWPENHPLKYFAEVGQHQMFCSMYGAQRLRAANIQVFNRNFPSEKVPPMLFKTSPELDLIWSYID